MYKNAKHGFTLIELSIVLVIIALLVSGVLVGRDLIHAARLRAVTTQTEAFSTAINVFKGKYNCLPGDCINSTQFFTGSVNGNGDGIIDRVSSAAIEIEHKQAWKVLGMDGLVEGNYTGGWLGGVAAQFWDMQNQSRVNLPESKYSGVHVMYRWYSALNQHVYYLGKDRPQAVYVGSDPFMAPVDALALDKKFDDGAPGTGRFQAVRGQIQSSGCYVDASTYDITDTQGCVILYY